MTRIVWLNLRVTIRVLMAMPKIMDTLLTNHHISVANSQRVAAELTIARKERG